MKIFKFCKNNRKIIFQLLFVLFYFFLFYLCLTKDPLSRSIVFLVILGISAGFNIYLFYPKRLKGEFSLKKQLKLIGKCLVYILNIITLLMTIVLLLSNLNLVSQFRPLILLGIAVILLYSMLEIFRVLLNVSLVSMILLFSVAILAALLIGAFSIERWALISGFIIIWNFINSKNFLTLLNRGREVAYIPPRINFIWQRNKIICYIATFLMYVVLVISSAFENDKMDIWVRAIVRLYSLLGVMAIVIVALLLRIWYRNSRKLQEIIDKRKQSGFLTMCTDVSDFYTKYHRDIIKLNSKIVKMNKRR